MTNNVPNMFQAMNSRVSDGLAHFAKGAALISLLIFNAAIFYPDAALAADMTGTLSIQAVGFAHDRGHAFANVFREADDVLKHETAYRKAKVEIHDGKASISIPDLPYGNYAVSVYHDENDNEILDHNSFHFPAEPLGFSNHFSLGLFSGMPSFEKMKFIFSKDKVSEEITVK